MPKSIFMRQIWNLTFLLILVFLSSRLIADEHFQVGPIFPLQQKHVHSSSIVELTNGDLIACWYHGSGERRANDVVIQASRFSQSRERWGPVFTIADTPGLPDCNPIFFVDAEQRLWLFWIIPIANRWERSVLKYRRAESFDENGMPRWTWQDTIHFVPGEEFSNAIEADLKKLTLDENLWAEYAVPYSRQLIEAAKDPVKRQTGWMPRTHPTVLPTGRILLPLYSDGFNVSLMGISDDNGETWRASRPIVGLGPIQPTVVHRSNGELVAYFRDSGAAPFRVQTSTSNDEGETWTVTEDTDIPNSGSSLEVIRIRDGRWVMAFNDTEQRRHRLALAVSDDEGKTWKWKKYVENDPSMRHGFSYPSLIQTHDGQIHVTYSYAGPDGSTIRHAAASVDWMTD